MRILKFDEKKTTNFFINEIVDKNNIKNITSSVETIVYLKKKHFQPLFKRYTSEYLKNIFTESLFHGVGSFLSF